VSTINRLYNFQAGQKIFSQQVDDELNQQVEAHNEHDGRIVTLETTGATTGYVDEQITQAMLGNPPLGGVTWDMLDQQTQDTIVNTQRVQANLVAIADINSQSVGQSGYGYDLFKGPASNLFSAAKLDTTRARVANTIGAGASAVTITDLSGGTFLKGQEVTLQDVVTDTIREKKIISNVSGNLITFTSGTTNLYAANANIYRSLGTVDTVNAKMDFGAALYPSASTVAGITADSTAVSSNDSANVRQIVQTARGWLVAVAMVTVNDRRLIVSKDGGQTWAQLCSNTANSTQSSLDVFGDTVYWGMTVANNATLFTVDTVSQTNVDIRLNGKTLTPFSTGSNGMYLKVDRNGGIHIVQGISGTTNQTMYAFSDDGGYSFSYEAFANSSYDLRMFAIVFDANNSPVIIAKRNDTPYTMMCVYRSGGAWTLNNSIGILSTSSTSFTCIAKRSGSNIGRIFVLTSTGTYTYSDNGGVTWAASQTVPSIYTTTPQEAVSLTENSNGDVVAIYKTANTSTLSYATCANGATTFGAAVTYDAAILGSSVVWALEYATFTVPVAIYNTTVTKFRGTFTATLAKELTQVDLRYNIVPPMGSMEELRSWVQHDEGPVSITSAFSNVSPATANESFVFMTASDYDLGSITERYFEGATATANVRCTQRITMSRAFTYNNGGLYKYLAALI
jgi:hypothetical protein